MQKDNNGFIIGLLLAIAAGIGVIVGLLLQQRAEHAKPLWRDVQEVREHLDRLQSQVDKLPGNRP